jgi:hypothetical protein
MGLPIPGGAALPFATLFVTGDAVLVLQAVSHTSPLMGGASFTFAVPNLPAAAGFPLTFQWGVLDPIAADGLSHSAAATAVLQ